jgi:hypothetical protein
VNKGAGRGGMGRVQVLNYGILKMLKMVLLSIIYIIVLIFRVGWVCCYYFFFLNNMNKRTTNSKIP